MHLRNERSRQKPGYARPRQHDGCPTSNSPTSYDGYCALPDTGHALVTEESVVSGELLAHKLLVILQRHSIIDLNAAKMNLWMVVVLVQQVFLLPFHACLERSVYVLIERSPFLVLDILLVT